MTSGAVPEVGHQDEDDVRMSFALPAGLDAERRARLIYCTVNGEFYFWLADDTATLREFLDVLLPERETRSRPGASGRSAPPMRGS
jgi:hypothetical protein